MMYIMSNQRVSCEHTIHNNNNNNNNNNNTPTLADEPPLVVCPGRTRAKVIADALGLKRGQVFRLDRERYRRLERLGPFEKAWLSLVAAGAEGGDEKVGVCLWGGEDSCASSWRYARATHTYPYP
jgi:hypothetical protein